MIPSSYTEWHSAFFFFIPGLRLWKIEYGNSCKKQTRLLKRTKIRVRSMMPWPKRWAKRGHPWSPCLREGGNFSDWPLNFLKMPWRFVKKSFPSPLQSKWMTLLKILSFWIDIAIRFFFLNSRITKLYTFKFWWSK